VRLLLNSSPEACCSLKKTADAVDLLACKTVEELRSVIVDKEIDGFTHMGCEQQLK